MHSDDHTQLNKDLALLLAKCARSDEQAFKEIYKLTSAKLFAILVRALGMNAASEQALQDTYVNIWLSAKDYRVESGQPMTWLTTIARSQASSVLRRRRANTETAVNLPAAKPSPTELAQVEFLDKREAAQTLETCLNQLDVLPRDCIVRAYAEGLSHKELSELHDTSIAGVKSWVHGGLLSLKGCVNGQS